MIFRRGNGPQAGLQRVLRSRVVKAGFRERCVLQMEPGLNAALMHMETAHLVHFNLFLGRPVVEGGGRVVH